LRPGVHGEAAGVDGLAGRAPDRDSGIDRLWHLEAPGGVAVRERRGLAVDRDGLTDEGEGGRRLRGLLDRNEGRELVVLLELLLVLRERHELLSELVGVERIERVLVL